MRLTSVWKIPYLEVGDRPSLHGITGQIAAAVEALGNALQQRIDGANTGAANAQASANQAQARADSAYAGFVARHRSATGATAPNMEGDQVFREVDIAERQYGWTGSQQSGVGTRVYVTRPGVYVVDGELNFLDPAANATIAGIRQGALTLNGSAVMVALGGVQRGNQSTVSFCKVVAVSSPGPLAIIGRQGQGSRVQYTASLSVAYVGSIPA